MQRRPVEIKKDELEYSMFGKKVVIRINTFDPDKTREDFEFIEITAYKRWSYDIDKEFPVVVEWFVEPEDENKYEKLPKFKKLKFDNIMNGLRAWDNLVIHLANYEGI